MHEIVTLNSLSTLVKIIQLLGTRAANRRKHRFSGPRSSTSTSTESKRHGKCMYHSVQLYCNVKKEEILDLRGWNGKEGEESSHYELYEKHCSAHGLCPVNPRFIHRISFGLGFITGIIVNYEGLPVETAGQRGKQTRKKVRRNHLTHSFSCHTHSACMRETLFRLFVWRIASVSKNASINNSGSYRKRPTLTWRAVRE